MEVEKINTGIFPKYGRKCFW